MVLFRVMRNSPISGTLVLSGLEKQLRERLPSTWRLTLRRQPAGSRGRRPDELLEIRDPMGKRATVVVEYKDRLVPRDVPAAVAQARAFAGDAVMVAAPFLGRRTREV